MPKEEHELESGLSPSSHRRPKAVNVKAMAAIEEKASDESSPEDNDKEQHDHLNEETDSDTRPNDDLEDKVTELQPKRERRDHIEDLEPHQKSILKGSNNYRIRPTLEKKLSFEDAKQSSDTIDQYYSKYNQNTIQSIDSRKSIKFAEQSKLPTPTATHSKFQKSFYWLALNHRRLGISHFAMIFILCSYALIGATIFYILEHKNEVETIARNKVVLLEFFDEVANELEEQANKTSFSNHTHTAEYLKQLYIRTLEKEGIYKWTTFYKDQGENYRKWHFSSAVFFVFNTFTTTGYGAITPETVAGKLSVIIYGTIVIPLTLVVVRDLGQLCLVYLTKLYAIVLISWRRARALSEVKDDEIIRLPMIMSMCTLALFLFGSTAFVHELDDIYGPGNGLNWLDSLYFAFISLTAIGYGDMMPNNVPFHPVIAILFFFGMPLMKVVNRITYVAIENGVFGTMTVLENRMDNWLSGNMPEFDAVSKLSSVNAPRSPSITTTNQRFEFDEDEDTGVRNEWLNNFTIRSIATFMKADGDVYAGGFGRVNLRKGDLLQNSVHDTVRSTRSNIYR